jgi:hypothetical protein
MAFGPDMESLLSPLSEGWLCVSHFDLHTSNFLRSASCGTALRWLRAIAAQFANGALDRLISHDSTLTTAFRGSMTRRLELSVRSKPHLRRVQANHCPAPTERPWHRAKHPFRAGQSALLLRKHNGKRTCNALHTKAGISCAHIA